MIRAPPSMAPDVHAPDHSAPHPYFPAQTTGPTLLNPAYVTLKPNLPYATLKPSWQLSIPTMVSMIQPTPWPSQQPTKTTIQQSRPWPSQQPDRATSNPVVAPNPVLQQTVTVPITPEPTEIRKIDLGLKDPSSIYVSPSPVALSLTTEDDSSNPNPDDSLIGLEGNDCEAIFMQNQIALISLGLLHYLLLRI